MTHTPLIRAQLRETQAKHLDDEEVMSLLREIKRLQGIVLAVRPLIAQWGQVDDATLDRVEWTQSVIELEPCVAERDYDDKVAAADGIAQKRNTFPRSPKYEADINVGAKPSTK